MILDSEFSAEHFPSMGSRTKTDELIFFEKMVNPDWIKRVKMCHVIENGMIQATKNNSHQHLVNLMLTMSKMDHFNPSEKFVMNHVLPTMQSMDAVIIMNRI